jgi:iron complex outermembrane receptor protein
MRGNKWNRLLHTRVNIAILVVLLAQFYFGSIEQVKAADDDSNSTVIITEQEIKDLQAHTMADILNTIPGIAAGSSSVSIHGNYKVKVFVDGRPLNDPTSSHGGIKWDLVTPDQVSQIEILLGKGGVRYGQNASGGVILVSTKSGNRLSGNVKTYAGSNNLFYGNTNMQLTSGPWSTEVNGGYETTDGYKVNNDKTRWQTGARLGYIFHDQFNISLSCDYLEDKRGFSGYPDYPTPYSRRESSMGTYVLQADIHAVNSKTFLIQGNKHNSDISRDLDKTIRVNDFGQELNSEFKTENWGTVNYGGAFYWSAVSGSAFDDQNENTTSAYVMDTMTLNRLPLTLAFGLRANINSGFDNALNPEAKATYKAKDWRITLAYSRTNNTPSFYQRYNETSSTRPNPDLTMEVADNYSLSFSTMLSKTMGGSATLVYNQLTDRITYVTNAIGGGQYQNFGKVTYTGGDLSLNWTPLDKVKVKASYTYMNAKDKGTGLFLSAKPEHKARLNLNYRPMKSLSMVLVIKATSEAYRNRANTRSVAGYTLADLKAEYDFGRFSLFGEVNNLTDKTYYYTDGLLAPPRAFFAGINLKI